MKKLNNLYITILFCSFNLGISINTIAQNPTPAKPQTKSILINGGTVHDGLGKVYNDASVGFKDGKII